MLASEPPSAPGSSSVRESSDAPPQLAPALARFAAHEHAPNGGLLGPVMLGLLAFVVAALGVILATR